MDKFFLTSKEIINPWLCDYRDFSPIYVACMHIEEKAWKT